MISNIQFLRAFAAIAVVLYHTDYRFPSNIHTEFQGVAMFFVISGFLIPLVAKKESCFVFLKHRILRIVPLYWIATVGGTIWFSESLQTRTNWILFAIVLALISTKTIAKLSQKLIEYTFVIKIGLGILFLLTCHLIYKSVSVLPSDHINFILGSMFFVPMRHVYDQQLLSPLLGVGWTLNIEVFFYIVFAFSMMLSKRLATLLTTFILLAVRYLFLQKICVSDACKLYANDYILFFIYGMILFHLFELAEKYKIVPSVKASLSLVLLATTFLILTNITPSLISGLGILAFVIGFGPALAVGAALMCHLSNLKIKWEWILILGNASYAIYLFQSHFIETFRALSSEYPMLTINTTSGMLVVLVVCCLGSVTIHTYIEKPIMKVLHPKRSSNNA
jgi:exopolysaccharide production protein ExoZ